MKTYLDCYPCFLRQALDAARMSGAPEAQQVKVLEQTLDLLEGLLRETSDHTPPEIGNRVHRLVREVVAYRDPYRKVKAAATERALVLYPRLQTLVATADDPLEMGVRVAIAGNIIDFGPRADYDLESTLERVLQQPFAIGDLDPLRQALEQGRQILYLADNAGETLFDRVFIEALLLPVRYAVKDGPILNDATLEDARAAGVDQVATLVSTGTDALGTVPSRSSSRFRALFASADVIIAKGQANYETLSPGDTRIFFLLQAKCPVIARDLGVEVGSIVLKQGRSHERRGA